MRRSEARRALELILRQHEWTHRRVDSIAFESNGETRRRISWDFTVPSELAISTGHDRVAVPLAFMKKGPLFRLDVRDATGASLSVWGRDDNAKLAARVLATGWESAVGTRPSRSATRLLERLVDSTGHEAEELTEQLWELLYDFASEGSAGSALMALISDLAQTFIFVVELPRSVIDVRSLVKLAYSDEPSHGSRWAWSSTYLSYIDLPGTSTAKSWHLEVRAPAGVAIRRLEVETWSDEDVPGSVVVAPPSPHTGHIAGRTSDIGSWAGARLDMRPARQGLINQTLLASSCAWVILAVLVGLDQHTRDLLGDAETAAGPAAWVAALPALLIASLVRGHEHALVSRLLMRSRAVNFMTALCLFAVAALSVLGASARLLQWGILLGFAVQTALLAIAFRERNRSVGGPDY